MSKEKSGLMSGSLLTTLLLVAFIVLKLCKVIDWSWWLVLSPFWIPIAIALMALIIYIPILLSKRKKQVEEKIIPTKSKWQERYEQMLENQKKVEALKNKG